MDNRERGVPLATLDAGEISAVHAAGSGELLLREAGLVPEFPQRLSDCLDLRWGRAGHPSHAVIAQPIGLQTISITPPGA
jgi:hypothetical protein